MDGFGEDILKELTPWTKRGLITAVDEGASPLFQLPERYPFDIGRLQYWRLAGTKAVVLRTEHAIDWEHVRLFLKFVRQWGNIGADELVYWIGDNTALDFCLGFSTLREVCHVLFGWPQHSYVAPESLNWCLHHTFEEDLVYCVAPEGFRSRSRTRR